MNKQNDIIFNYRLVQENPIVRLHYAEIESLDRDAPLMIFLHGFSEYWYAWSDYLPHFADLGFHVVAPDLRGFNKSDRPPMITDYDIKFLVLDIKNLIKSFGKEKAIVVGHDWGGAITWELATTFPEVCAAIIVLNSPHRGAYANNIRANPLVNIRQIIRSWYIYFFLIPHLPEWALKCCDFKWARYNWRGWAVNKKAFDDVRIIKYINALSIPGALSAELNYYRANTKGEYGMGVIKAALGLKKFNKIKAPTFLIWAEDDRALEKALSYNMDEFFENIFKIKYLPQTSHWVHLERPEEVKSLIQQFLNSLPPRTWFSGH